MKINKISESAAEIMVNRYALRDASNKVVESPEEIFKRTARVISEAENNYRNGVTIDQVREKLFLMMGELRVVPNGRTMANAGTKYGQLANCFVLPVDDDLGKGTDSIFSVLRKSILTLQTGGGVGFSFGRIRPKGGRIGASKGKATGAVSFVKVFDTAFWVIGQGGGRRSAAMAVLPVWHPDIYEFIRCKAEEGTIENFNISVGLTDEFMEAVKNDDDFALRYPENGELWKMVPARELYGEIVKYSYKNGEPGVLFLSAAERDNPVPHLYELEATNPCVVGETKVATPNGWRRVDSINKGEEICTVLGVGKVESVEVNKDVPVFDLYLSDGGVVRATASHQFHARDTRTKFFIPTRLDKLKEGQLIRVAPAMVPNNKVKISNSKLDDKTFGFLVGVLLGDGSYTKRSLERNVVRISTHADEDDWNMAVQVAFRKIGVTDFYTYTNKNSKSMLMDPKPGKLVADWVKSTLLIPTTSLEKEIPEEYLNSNREFLVGLLDGLISTDGSVDLSSNHPMVRFHTGSKKLAEQVRRILLMFGIHGRNYKSKRRTHKTSEGRIISNNNPKYDVIVAGESFGRFYEQIELSHPKKQMRMKDAAMRCNFTGGNWAATVRKVEPAGRATVYDLFEKESDTWITEGYVSRGCGEQFLGPYENCCLASVNLANHVKGKGEEKGVEWDKLAETVKWTVRLLDNVVDVNKYVAAVPELEEAAKKVRRIGVSVMGLSDMMYLVGVRYGSSSGQEFASQIMEFVRYHAMTASIELAKSRGAFPGITGSVYDPSNMVWKAPKPLVRHKTNWGRPDVKWKEVIEGIKKWGIRNGAQTTVAPTGSIATISGLEGYGCEPVYALSYTRNTREGAEKQGKEWIEIEYESQLFAKQLAEHGIKKSARNIIFEKVRDNDGSCQGIEVVPKEIQDKFVVASDLSVDEHVRMQAVMQRWVDNSISKTINFPPSATADEVAHAFQLGWKLGLKGMTVYVEGSREQVVLEKKKPFVPNGNSQEKCPECDGPLRMEEGCATCPSCAYSRCDK